MNNSDAVKMLLDPNSGPFVVGEKVFIRMTVYHCTGRIVGVKNYGDNYFLILEDAAWIAKSGRFMNAIEGGPDMLDEVEPVSLPVRINIGTIQDVFCWDHPLPRDQK